MHSSQAPPSLANRTRVRVGGLVFRGPALLLVEHEGIWDNQPFWTPPGGEVEFGETLAEAAIREVREETGLDVAVGPLRYVLDFVRRPLHAVSFYFECDLTGSVTPATGADPELGSRQLIRSARFVPLAEVRALVVYPEGLGDWLERDLRDGWSGSPRYMGPLV